MRNVRLTIGSSSVGVILALLVAAPALGSTNVSGTISTNTEWTVAGSPYIATGSVTVALGVVLTIDSGVTVKMSPQTYLQVSGRLLASGTSASPITITSSQSTPGAGDWAYLRFYTGSDPASQLSYVTVSYAGNGSAMGVAVTSSSPVLDHLTVSHTAGTGVIVGGSSAPSMTGCTFSQNTSYGLWVRTGSSLASIDSTTIANNGDYAVYAETGAILPALTGVTMTGNGGGAKNAIGYQGGTITSNLTWHAGAPWVALASVTINPGVVLTIDPGVTVKMSPQTYLQVSGRLLASGTSASPITITSSQSTPGAGDWAYLRFYTGSDPASQLSYVTVSYAGNGSAMGVAVTSSSPVLDHLTVSHTAGTGVIVGGSSAPSMTGCAFSQNSSYGLWVRTGSSLASIDSTTIANNGDYAVYAETGAILPALTGVTMTGNGGGAKNAIGYQGGTITSNLTWHAGAPWVALASVTINPGVVLTIDPGVTVKMSPQTYLQVSGRLLASGTSASPITITSSQSTPAAGDWAYLRFYTGSDPASQLSYVTVSYAGNWSALGIAVTSSSPVLDHLTVSHTAGTGVIVGGSSAPSMTGCTFSQNTSYGLWVRTGSALASIDSTTIANNGDYAVYAETGAILPALTGVTMTGNGGGAKNAIGYQGGTISSNLTWHAGAPWVALASVTINPGVVLSIDPGVTVKMSPQTYFQVSGRLLASGTSGSPITFTSSQSTPAAGDWQYLYLAMGNNPASQLSYATVWYAGYYSGRGISVADGTPSFDHVTVASTAGTGMYVTGGSPTITNSTFTQCTGNGLQIVAGSPTFDHVTVTQAAGSGIGISGGTVALSFSTVSSSSGAGISVSGGSIVSVFNSSFIGNGSGLSNSNPSNVVHAHLNFWNSVTGPSGSGPGTGQSVSTGVTYEPWLTQGAVDANYVTSVTVTNHAFNPTIFRNAGLTFSTTQGTSWTVTMQNSSNAVVRTISGSGANGVVTWDGTNDEGVLQPNGIYTYQIGSATAGGLQCAPVRGRLVLDTTATAAAFTASQDVLEFSAASGGSVKYTSVVPIIMIETLVVKNRQGQVVRTLVSNLQRVDGTYVDAWDGRNDAGMLVPDGPYFYVVTVDDGVNAFTWDLSAQYWGNYTNYTDGLGIQSFDPFNNCPLRFSYSFDQPGRVTIALTSEILYKGFSCENPPPSGALCLVNRKYEESGAHTFVSAGVDVAGVYRAGGFKYLTLVTERGVFAKNAVVLFGSKPTVQNLVVTAPVLAPGQNESTVAFDLGTFQSQPADVTVTFLNQSSVSVLRTITLPAQSPGHVTVPWDGRADNGMCVAPGAYTITVTVADTIGNQVQGQILATVQP